MQRIKSFLARAVLAVIVFAGFGFGIVAVGFAIVLGGAFMLALHLAGPRIVAEAERRAETARDETFEGQPASA